MAWQLHYTSARQGPTGRAGFQFTAETPGLPEGLRAAVAPFLAYRPPPEAPLSPGPDELAAFPVALLYDRVAGRVLLLRSRYLGQDYSGRYGNFFAHAVVAERDELEGLRPAELWDAPVWAPEPAGVPDLPELAELTPGTALAPDVLADWLAAQDHPDVLPTLLDSVVAVLDRGHGRIVLVDADSAALARWIAVVAYSLPPATAAHLTFLTYTADPDGSTQRLVGTTPGVWSAAQYLGDAVYVPARGLPPGGPPSRYARAAADCWRTSDFATLDTLAELAALAAPADDAPPGADALARAAALLALCRGESGVSPEEERAAASLLRGDGTLPEWVWRDLVPGVPSMGLDLAVAVHDQARAAGAADVAGQCALRAAVVALAEPALRPRLPRRVLPDALLLDLTTAARDALARARTLTDIAEITGIAASSGAPPRPADVTDAARALTRSGHAVDEHARADPAADRAGAPDSTRPGARDDHSGAAGHGGLRLAEAVERCPGELRDALVDGVVAGLEATDDGTRAAALDARAAALLHAVLRERPARFDAAPGTAVAVLAAVAGRRPDRRVALTGELLRVRVSAEELAPVLERVWAAEPTPAECLDLLTGPPGHPVLAALPSRAFAAALDLTSPDVLRLAARVLAVRPDGPAARDAHAVRACATAATADDPGTAAQALTTLTNPAHDGSERFPGTEADGADRGRGSGAGAGVVAAAFGVVAERAERRTPGYRAALLAALPADARDRLAAAWMRRLAGRGNAERRGELVEVVLRLRASGGRAPGLEDWARDTAAGWLRGRRLDARFAGDPALRAALRALVAEGRGR
ncbi:hypothetical protein [Actinomadura flavalba]|uniref:GAP1-N2 domain-containing protein n=1 Tax=Actinomadura flavalba TaxID=1120938 RepID=UPI00036758B4|nr:hypothetical protein [Actinomadura flavalba]